MYMIPKTEWRLILIDECGDEIEAGRFLIPSEMDEDAVWFWQMQKKAELLERYTEARGAYWEHTGELFHQMWLRDRI